MTETDKLLVRIGTARDAISRKTEQTSLDYMIDGVLMNCSVLLKEQEKQKRQWLKEIAENQIAHAPNGYPMSLDEKLENEYKRGIWGGLQIAWNIISEGR